VTRQGSEGLHGGSSDAWSGKADPRNAPQDQGMMFQIDEPCVEDEVHVGEETQLRPLSDAALAAASPGDRKGIIRERLLPIVTRKCTTSVG